MSRLRPTDVVPPVSRSTEKVAFLAPPESPVGPPCGRPSAPWPAAIRSAVVVGDPLGLLPGLLLGVGDDRAEREAVAEGAPVLGRRLSDGLHPGGDRGPRLAPEGVDVGLGRPDLDGRRRGAGEVQRDAARGHRLDRAEGALVAEELALEVEGRVLGPDAADDGHDLAGAAVAGVMGHEVALAALVGLVAAGDEVDGDPPAAGQVVERGGHPGQRRPAGRTRAGGPPAPSAVRCCAARWRPRPSPPGATAP